MFKFEKTDLDWSDYSNGLTPERDERLRLVIREVTDRVCEMTALHDLTVEVPYGLFSVGVEGDSRTCTPIVMLKGPFLDWEILAEISTKISNTLPINRVTFEPTTL